MPSESWWMIHLTAFGMFGHPAPFTPTTADKPAAPWALCPSGWAHQSLRHLTWTLLAPGDQDGPGESTGAVWISRGGIPRHLTGMSIAKLTRATAMVTPADGPSWRSQTEKKRSERCSWWAMQPSQSFGVAPSGTFKWICAWACELPRYIKSHLANRPGTINWLLILLVYECI